MRRNDRIGGSRGSGHDPTKPAKATAPRALLHPLHSNQHVLLCDLDLIRNRFSYFFYGKIFSGS